MADVRTMKLNLLADVTQFGKSLSKADQDTKSFSSKMKGYGKVAAKAFAVAGVAAGAFAIKIGVDSVKAAAEDEAAASKLAGTLKNVVGATDATIKSTEEFITSMQMATGISDNELRKGMARLVRSTKNVAEAQKLSTLATNISAATGKDYTVVAEALAKANDGNTKALKRLGITLGDNATNAADLVSGNKKLEKAQTDLQYAYDNFGPTSEEYVKAQEKVVEAQDKVNAITAEGVDWVKELSTEFAGSAAAKAKTYAGQLAILNERWGELKEGIGQKAIPILKRLLEQVNLVAIGFSGEDQKKGLTNKVRALSNELDGKSGGVKLGESLKDVADSFGQLFGALSGDKAKSGNSNLETLATALQSVASGINNIANGYRSLKKLGQGALDLISLRMLFGPGAPFAEGGKFNDVFNRNGKAAGGFVKSGQAVRVGEFGPETFIPGNSGFIQKASASNGNGVTIIMNGVIDGESARRSIERLLQDSARRTGAINLIGATL